MHTLKLNEIYLYNIILGVKICLQKLNVIMYLIYRRMTYIYIL